MPTIEELRANSAANLIISKITKKPRRIIRSQGPIGGYYETLDNGVVTADHDPLRRPVDVDQLKYKFDASEIFATAPNGMWRVALYGADGKRQDSVPDVIAKDTSDPRSDGRVLAMISCYRCHQEAGLRPFTDDQQRLIAGRITLKSYSADVVQRVADFYDAPRLQRAMEFDRDTFTAALKTATSGEAPESAAKILTDFYGHFTYDAVSPETAALECGFPDVATFRTATAMSKDPMILLLRDGQSIHRGQWETSFQEAALAALAAVGMPMNEKGVEQ